MTVQLLKNTIININMNNLDKQYIDLLKDIVGFFHYECEGSTHRYYPDIYIKSENQIIEVKSTYTFNKEKEKNLIKRESVINKGINFKFIIL
jgi:hypothetical protein